MRTHLIVSSFVLLLCSSCSTPYLGVKIPFVATWGGEALDCNDTEIALSDLRLYVSEIELRDSRGNAQKLVLHDDIPWQQRDLALIDLEDNQGACRNGSSDVYAYLVGSVPPGEYEGLRFTVGVPFEQNHSDPLKAEAPLDNPAMHWHWRAGYKFLRAGVRTATDGFWIHLGSAGCEGTVREISGCRFPNRVNVALDEFIPRHHAVSIDLKALFAGMDLSDGVSTDCSSGPPEKACVAPFKMLGIDFESGKHIAQQQVFTVLR